MPADPQPTPTAAHTETEHAVIAPKVRAVIHARYGPTNALHVGDIDRPVIGDIEVLVRMHAATLHIGDCFDASHGACAGYARAGEDQLAPKPANLTFEEAAAVPTSSVAALRDAGKLQAGQKVLINGAFGGVGTFGARIAKALGADVTGVCGNASRDIVRLLGADRVIDYTELHFTYGIQRYDLILDNIENHVLADCRRALTSNGTLVLNTGTGARGIRLMTGLVTRSCCRHSPARRCAGSSPPRTTRTYSCSTPSSRAARSLQSSTGPTRWPRRRRRSSTTNEDTPAEKSSSPCSHPDQPVLDRAGPGSTACGHQRRAPFWKAGQP